MYERYRIYRYVGHHEGTQKDGTVEWRWIHPESPEKNRE